MLLLIFAWVFALLSGIIGMIALLHKPVIARLTDENDVDYGYDVFVSIILSFL